MVKHICEYIATDPLKSIKHIKKLSKSCIAQFFKETQNVRSACHILIILDVI